MAATVWVAIQYGHCGDEATLWGAYSSEEEAAAGLWADYIEHHPGSWEREPVDTRDGPGFNFKCVAGAPLGGETFEVRPCKVDERL